MNEDTRNACTPQEYILKLFDETVDGKLKITYFPLFDQTYSLKYKMNWTKEDAQNMVQRYNKLTAALARIGEVHDKLGEETVRQELLTEYEVEVWNTYIRPFTPFEVDLDVITELYFRRETDSLEDEENELLERHYEWFVTNSRQRLPFDKVCPSQLVNRAQRYERLKELDAPECVVDEEGRFLAEKLVLYYHCVKELSYDMLRFTMAQKGTYSEALDEIKSGKKSTHWMWFVFPQMRGLGKSDMAYTYGIVDSDEARAYLEHEELGPRLIEITEVLLELDEDDPYVIFGDIDAVKLCSSMTLFASISEEGSVFHEVLEKFYGGKMDPKTLRILANEE